MLTRVAGGPAQQSLRDGALVARHCRAAAAHGSSDCRPASRALSAAQAAA